MHSIPLTYGTSELSATHLKHTQSKISKKTPLATQHTIKCGRLAPVIAWLIGRVAAQRHERVSCHELLAQEKIKSQNSKNSFYRMCITFAPS